MSDLELLTIPRAAIELHVSRRTAQYEVARTGTLFGAPIVIVNGRRRVSRAALERAVTGQQAAS